MEQTAALYDVVGEEFFFALVDEFYSGVADDAELRPLYPEADLAGARARLSYFLIQYWGGPNTYSDHRGHPRLRMRHAPFSVDRAARDAWLRHMSAALDVMDPAPEVRSALWEYFERSADFMRNVDEGTVDEGNVDEGGDLTEGV